MASFQEMIFTLMQNKLIKKVLIFGFWIIMWQGLYWFVNEPLFLVGPVDTVKCLIRLLVLKNTYIVVLGTMGKIAAGFVAALFFAIVMAFFAWKMRMIREGLAPFLAFLKAVPIASIIILCLAWFSSSGVSVFIAGFVTFPMVYFEMLSALDNIDVGILEVLKVYRVTPWKQFRYVYLPAICDQLVVTAKVTVGMCIRAGVAAELIGVPKQSLGEMLYKAKIYLEIADLFAWTVLIVVVGYFLEKFMICCVEYLDCRIVKRRNNVGGEQDER